MAVIAKINTGSNIGQVKLTQQTRSTIAAQNFSPKPNVSLAEIIDVSIVDVQDGDALIFDSATGKYTMKTLQAFVTEINGGQF